jgi:GNAT superfamily N-acetyltransferase
MTWPAGVEADAFAIGLFLESLLIGTGCCFRQWRHLGIDAHFYAGDFVAPNLRGRGLSRVLHRHRLLEAARRGIPQVYAAVSADNVASFAGFVAAGFGEIHRPEWLRRIERHYRGVGARARRLMILGRHT